MDPLYLDVIIRAPKPRRKISLKAIINSTNTTSNEVLDSMWWKKSTIEVETVAKLSS